MNISLIKKYIVLPLALSFCCGCGVRSDSRGENVTQHDTVPYRYHRTIHSVNSKSRQDDGGPLRPGERYAYSYAFRRADLESLDRDFTLAIRKFVGIRNAAPQCVSGFEVVDIGTTENMGIVIGVLECWPQ